MKTFKLLTFYLLLMVSCNCNALTICDNNNDTTEIVMNNNYLWFDSNEMKYYLTNNNEIIWSKPVDNLKIDTVYGCLYIQNNHLYLNNNNKVINIFKIKPQESDPEWQFQITDDFAKDYKLPIDKDRCSSCLMR